MRGGFLILGPWAVFALPLDEAERERFRRRGGKSRNAALAALHLAIR